MEVLPEDCIAHVLSFGSPRDSCRSAVVASVFRDAAESEVLWGKFLPPDHRQIISRSVFPVMFKSNKELFFKLSTPILVDGGRRTFSIDKETGKKCYMLSARDLYIAWSANPLFWCWKPLLQSRFGEAVELRMTSWLEIQGKIGTRVLSPDTIYGAYVVIEVAHYRAYGLDILPMEVSIEVGEFHSRGTIILSCDDCSKGTSERVCHRNEDNKGLGPKFGDDVPRKRMDGWLEIKLGEFYNDEKREKDVKMRLREVDGVHLKGGLIVEGIEIRPIK
ncbi:F-box protein PP2-B15-like [Cynara cardunculus var. scolymus]|uniref:F-box domain, cyclin-like protein n=1 Tax=Cynara cardunculus var. scolymus TaxID=59895 RepID=A0A118K0N9_CYNCS|nr:F-box protein PP2-B15-like [Cynara cardunculus var. scolymus]KVI01697.1 F-box domain, cyclin-like protein [Cynara cardunculus var. scolymus]